MKKILFINDRGWSNIKATLYSGEAIGGEQLLLDGSTLEFNSKKYSSLSFSDGGERTSRVYPGNMSVGVEYKENVGMAKNLTYLYSEDLTRSGRVDNYVLRDEHNLSYRDDKSKKISVFIPASYDGVTPHDILYFFDAQNLFCMAGDYTECGDPYGSWQLDILITELHRQYGENIIVVGIDNADMYRSHELFMNPDKFGRLSPLATAIDDDDFSQGYLERLSSFMVTTLHSFIKEKYCVKEDNIGIGGASMGGIASFFCSIFEMGFYKYALSYSPAFGLYEMDAFERWFGMLDFKKYTDYLPGIHIYCGGGDMLEQNLLPAAKAMKPLLCRQGYPAHLVFETYDSEKPHNEESWRLILPESFSRLLDLKG